MRKSKLSPLLRAAMMTVVTVLCSWIALPTPWGVPVTLQTLAVALCGTLLGPYYGMAAVGCYLALGTIGLPVFSGFRGAVGALFGPTGGYLLGFFPLVFFLGLGKGRKKLVTLLFSAAGLVSCHFLGAFWFSRMGKIPFASALYAGSLPYLLKDILSIFLAYRMAKRHIAHKNP